MDWALESDYLGLNPLIPWAAHPGHVLKPQFAHPSSASFAHPVLNSSPSHVQNSPSFSYLSILQHPTPGPHLGQADGSPWPSPVMASGVSIFILDSPWHVMLRQHILVLDFLSFCTVFNCLLWVKFCVLMDSLNKYLFSIYYILGTLLPLRIQLWTKENTQQFQSWHSCRKIHPPSGLRGYINSTFFPGSQSAERNVVYTAGE